MGLLMCVLPDPSPCPVLAERSSSHHLQFYRVQARLLLPALCSMCLSSPWGLSVASFLPNVTPTATQGPAPVAPCLAGPALSPGLLQLFTNLTARRPENKRSDCEDT